MSSPWHPDVLDGYQSRDLPLPDVPPAPGEPPDVEMVATLVRRLPTGTSRRAVLYLHGWNDYFFQTHLADAWAELGFDFFAVDLRRYGRSLRSGQLRGFVTDLDDYAVELDAAADLIAADHDELVLMGHSTGGLVAALYAANRPDRVHGLVLNAPWLDLQAPLLRTVGPPVLAALSSRNPTSVLRLPADGGFYARTIHRSLGGEWDYDLDLKPTPSAPVRAGWLLAILHGHQRVAAGLGIAAPILVLASSASDFSRRWHDGLAAADTVLDVEQIATKAVRLGSCVTVVRIAGGLHDLILSPAEIRTRAFTEIARFVRGYLVPVPTPAAAREPPAVPPASPRAVEARAGTG